MARYIIKRILSMIPVFLILTFARVYPFRFCTGQCVGISASEQRLTEEAYEALVHEYGLDQPLPLRYVNWLADFAQGDLGESIRSKAPGCRIDRRPVRTLATTHDRGAGSCNYNRDSSRCCGCI